ncbi:hypothetical protein RA28_18585 [Ruegeria sp. ANG-S4]|uniref:hypothetical protein n=1 Tax=Ruegeria sp. ANG-S4 TaxID=1577904 RepID=UPI00057EB255|nr:hypothetical protein [Ruegeria sp. ANG-S4]KIC43656.1 hypothetical protein RA28_18585 [Ruegeria sp. ANG-S4]
MSKVEQILASNGRGMTTRHKSGLRGGRARMLLVALVALLTAFLFFTQPEVVSAFESLIQR